LSIATAAASAAAGSCAAAQSGFPAPVTMPPTAITSLATTPIPASGPSPSAWGASAAVPGTSAPIGSAVIAPGSCRLRSEDWGAGGELAGLGHVAAQRPEGDPADAQR